MFHRFFIYVLITSLLPHSANGVIGALSFNTKKGILDLSPRKRKKLYAEALSTAKLIAQSCPREDCLIIGVGRSPALVIEGLKYLKKKNFVEIPLSNFSYNSSSDNKLDEDSEKKLYHHFSNFLTRPMGEGKLKKVIVLDFAMTGASIFAVSQYLESYFKNSNINIEIQLALLKSKGSSEYFLIKRQQEYGVDHLKLKIIELKNDLSQVLIESKADKVSRYSKFDLIHDEDFSLNESLDRERFVSDFHSALFGLERKASSLESFCPRLYRLFTCSD